MIEPNAMNEVARQHSTTILSIAMGAITFAFIIAVLIGAKCLHEDGDDDE